MARTSQKKHCVVYSLRAVYAVQGNAWFVLSRNAYWPCMDKVLFFFNMLKLVGMYSYHEGVNHRDVVIGGL